MSWREVPFYVAAQIIGASVGVAAAHIMFELPLFFASRHARSGMAQAFSEFVATFGLLAVIWGCARLRSAAVPFAVAAYITAAYWFTASTSFANPAVTLAVCDRHVRRYPARRRTRLHTRATTWGSCGDEAIPLAIASTAGDRAVGGRAALGHWINFASRRGSVSNAAKSRGRYPAALSGTAPTRKRRQVDICTVDAKVRPPFRILSIRRKARQRASDMNSFT